MTTLAFLAYYPPNTLANVAVVWGQNTVLPVVTAVPTRTYKLTRPNWHLTGYLYDVAGANGAADLYAQMPACERDNFYRFNVPNQFVRDEGATKYTASDPQTETGTWAFGTNLANLNLSLPGTPLTSCEVTALNDITLQLRGHGATTGGASYTTIITYTAF